jgi:glycosyltransferase involved in cell wall biosynthesis
MDVSVIIPLFNESESLKELDDWISLSFKYKDLVYEVIYIDDGSNDSSWDIIKTISHNNLNRKGISFIKNYGKSQALRVGFLEAKGKYIATLDADLQDSPEEIPLMINLVLGEVFRAGSTRLKSGCGGRKSLLVRSSHLGGWRD